MTQRIAIAALLLATGALTASAATRPVPAPSPAMQESMMKENDEDAANADGEDRGGKTRSADPAREAPSAVSSAAAALQPTPAQLAAAVRSAADIDAALEEAWAKVQLTPTPAAPPEVWLRRVWLDLAGQIPPPAEVRAFAADASPAARARVVERLLAGPDWAGHWGRVIARGLVAPRAEPDGAIAKALEKGIGDRLASGATWPSVARNVVVGGGETDASAAFRSQFAEAPYEIAGQMGSGVFGMRLRCAQCHDDPMQGWKVADYYGLAAFFGSPKRLSVPAKLYEQWKAGKVRNFYELVMNVPEMRPSGSDHRWVRKAIEGYANELRQLARMGLGSAPIPQVTGLDWAAYDVYRIHAQRKMAKGEGGYGRRTNILSDRDGGDLIMPPLPVSPLAADHAPPPGKPVLPRWPGAPSRPAPAKGTRRAALASFVGDPSNLLVARAFVNRVWSELMGRGLVEPVDEVVRPTEARHAALLERLATGFVAHNGNVKWLLSTITATRAYGLACATGDSAAALPSRPLTRAHSGLEIELGAKPLPGAAIVKVAEQRAAQAAIGEGAAMDVVPAGKPLRAVPAAPLATPALSVATPTAAPEVKAAVATSTPGVTLVPMYGALVPVPPPVVAAPAPVASAAVPAPVASALAVPVPAASAAAASVPAPSGAAVPVPAASVAATTPAAPAPAASVAAGPPEAAPYVTSAPAEKADPEVMFAVHLARPLDAVEVEAALRRATGREATASTDLSKALARSFDPEGAPGVVDGESGMRRGGLPRGLFLLTGPELQRAVDEAPLLASLGSAASSTAALDELFIRTLGRPPEPGERARLAEPLAQLPSNAAARRTWADMLWALVSSAEFLTNH